MSEHEFSIMLESARRICMTPEEQEQQRRSFAYGNANIENDAVTRAVVDQVANELAQKPR
ncbi:MAG: hypothetical protein ABSD96_20385 [Candidatus Korobacteraceae bacterium]|jgi:hypothetical protein